MALKTELSGKSWAPSHHSEEPRVKMKDKSLAAAKQPPNHSLDTAVIERLRLPFEAQKRDGLARQAGFNGDSSVVDVDPEG